MRSLIEKVFGARGPFFFIFDDETRRADSELES
jgi:hypothetical protein